MNVMVTGGAGYIGSHAVKRLLDDGHHVVVIDALINGHAEAIHALASRTTARGDRPGSRLVFRHCNTNNRDLTERLLREHRVEAVMHFAAMAQVGESVDQPLRYYRENINGMVALLEACDAASVQRFVFSSSCATYGNMPDDMIPLPEHCPQRPASPYGQTKLDGEKLLLAYAEQQRRLSKPFGCAMLRYFNVAGCDPAGAIGEDHRPETHLVPVAIQAALGLRDKLTIFGTDYPTADGTCVRDYVHVDDLISAHVLAIDRINPTDPAPVPAFGGSFGGPLGSPASGRAIAYNVGIGKGYSVREVIDSVMRVSGRRFPVVEVGRRAGDANILYNKPDKVMHELGWRPVYTDLDEIVRHAWNWMSKHPTGYPKL